MTKHKANFYRILHTSTILEDCGEFTANSTSDHYLLLLCHAGPLSIQVYPFQIDYLP